ncbi:MAG: outer membrane lipoprotein carrier protein LolA [Bacteroidales bacterium]|nr:outer membrane lipoprotein carrier protein LolA [Bacteroidales bacterium]
MRLLAIILLLIPLTLSGQNKLTAERQKEILEKIDAEGAKMSSMQCEFTQTKSMKMLSRQMVSQGKMYFKKPNRLLWQYSSPYDYTFLLNGDNVQIKTSKSTQNINVQENKIFRRITGIIVDCITGAGLKNSPDFTSEIWEKDGAYFARLYPKKKELKQIYEVVEIFFNPSFTMVSSVRMVEKSGDETLVKLNKTKINAPLKDEIFAVD